MTQFAAVVAASMMTTMMMMMQIDDGVTIMINRSDSSAVCHSLSGDNLIRDLLLLLHRHHRYRTALH
jgi:hypothetical protein